jgi:hypothetical protein
VARTTGPKGAQASGSGRVESRTAEGRQAGESQERRNSDLFGGREEFRQRRERSEEEEKITRVNAAETEVKRKWNSPDAENGRHGKTSRTRPATVKVEEEAGKAKRPATASYGEPDAVPHRYDHLGTLKIPPTSRELPGPLRRTGIPSRLNPL